jgi:phosphatidylserine decarboxylase
MIKQEQRRQARHIHGGLLRCWAAALGVKLSRVRIPSKRLRLLVYRNLFAKKYPPGLNECEAERPLWEYPSLNAVFTRGLRPEFRPIAAGGTQFLSPCDGTAQDLGVVTRGKLLTVKGIEYGVEELMPGMDPRLFEGGHYAVIFLSPIDCHRVFSPYGGHLDEVVHVPGYRLLVHPPFQRPEYPPYSLNERVVFRLATARGPCALVMVAGWGVGHITVPLAPALRPRGGGPTRHAWSPPVPVRPGEWIGTFELGSTVVLITPPGPETVPAVRPNEKVRYGQPVFTQRA